jgi:hypothetical protein
MTIIGSGTENFNIFREGRKYFPHILPESKFIRYFFCFQAKIMYNAGMLKERYLTQYILDDLKNPGDIIRVTRRSRLLMASCPLINPIRFNDIGLT